MTTANIDGDIIVFRAAFAAEHTIYKVRVDGEEHIFPSAKEKNAWLQEHGHTDDTVTLETVTELEPVYNAYANARSMIDNIIIQTQASEVIIYLSGDNNFRKQKHPTYKAHRKDALRPTYERALLEYLRSNFQCEQEDTLEADDLLGINQKHNTVLCSTDKDLDMIAGEHFNFVRNEAYFISPEDADYFFMCQLLTGDVTDNVAGIRGIGPKKADKLLRDYYGDPSEMYEIILDEYTKAFGNEGPRKGSRTLADTAEQLWILRDRDKDWKSVL